MESIDPKIAEQQALSNKMAKQKFTPEVPRVYNGETNEQIDPSKLDSDSLAELYSNGTIKLNKADKIPVISPYGEVGSVDATEMKQALSAGYKIDAPKDQFERFIKEKYSSTPELIKTGIEGAARGLSIGLSDPILKAFGADVSERKEVNPLLAGTTEIGGMFAPALMSGGASLLPEAGAAGAARVGLKTAAKMTPIELVTQASRAVEGKVATALGTEAAEGGAKTLAQAIIQGTKSAAPKVLAGATEGALFGVGGEISESALGDHELSAENILAYAGMGAVIGGGIGAAIHGVELSKPIIEKAVDKIRPGVSSVAKKAVATFTGLGEKDIDLILKAKQEAPEIAAMSSDAARELQQDLIMQHGEKISEGKALEKMTTEERKAASDRAESEFKRMKDEHSEGLQKEMYGVASDIATDQDKLLQGAIHKSKDIQQNLLVDGWVPVKQIKSQIEDSIAELSERGQAEHFRAADKLKAEIQQIEDLAQMSDKPGFLPANDVKKRIMGLDDVIQWDRRAAGYDAAMNGANKDMRFALDSTMKEHIPGYRDAMKDVSSDFDLANRLKRYSEPDRAFNNLNKLSKAEAFEKDVKHLKELGEKFGKDYAAKAETLLNESKVVRGSKSFEDLTDSIRWGQKLQEPKIKETIQRMIGSSEEFKTLQEAILAEKNAKMIVAGYDGLSEKSFQTLINKSSRGDKIALEQLRGLGFTENGKNLADIIPMIGAQGRVGNTFTHGSKNVLTGLVLGGMTGHALPGLILGAVIDKFGPKIGKMLVDGAMHLAAMEKMGINVANKAADHINQFLGAKTLPQAIGEKVIPVVTKPEHKKEDKKNKYSMTVAEYRKFSEQIAKNSGDPSLYIDRKADENKSIAKFAPNIANQLGSKQTQALMFLQSKMPKDPLAQYYFGKSARGWAPSDFELSQFSKYVEALNDPTSVVESLKHGTMVPEQVETLKTVYPKLYQSLADHIIERISTENIELSYDKRRALSAFLGQPLSLDTDPKFCLAMQLNFNKNLDNSQSGPKYAPGNVGKMDLTNKMSGTEKIANRA